MSKPKLKALTFLAPNMLHIYQFIIKHLNARLKLEIELQTGAEYDEVLNCDLAFICGLPYVLFTSPYMVPSRLEALAAPVLQGERFQGTPVYFSEVIVHRDSSFQTFADLRGCSWAFNEPFSQSGCGITCYHLAKIGETKRYFEKVVESGYHQTSIQMVCDRTVDASAIDVQVLACELSQHPQLAEQLRIIDSLGPSTIQPLAAGSYLPAGLKQDIREVLTELHLDPQGRSHMNTGFIDRWAVVDDSDYDDIREMHTVCQRAGLVSLL